MALTYTRYRLLFDPSIPIRAGHDYTMSCKFTFSEEQLRTIEIITYIGASLSILGCCLIILSYVKFTVLRTFPYKLIVFLSLADLFASIAYFLNLSAGQTEAEKCAGGSGCILAAVVTQFFDVATFFWTAVIAFNLRQVLIENKGRVVENYELYYHLVAWGIPALLAVIVGCEYRLQSVTEENDDVCSV